MTLGDDVLVIENVESTMTSMASALLTGCCPDILMARHQTAGRGRFGRTWVSKLGESLTMSCAFRAYRGHPKPWIIGMQCAVSVANVIGCKIQWPNDLVWGLKKVGGVLTELLPDNSGQLVPVVGIGINANIQEFPPDLVDHATSLFLETGVKTDVDQLFHLVTSALRSAQEPNDWTDLQEEWLKFDATPGKCYRSIQGRNLTAINVDDQGRLVARDGDQILTVMAAEALFGHQAHS